MIKGVGGFRYCSTLLVSGSKLGGAQPQIGRKKLPNGESGRIKMRKERSDAHGHERSALSFVLRKERVSRCVWSSSLYEP